MRKNPLTVPPASSVHLSGALFRSIVHRMVPLRPLPRRRGYGRNALPHPPPPTPTPMRELYTDCSHTTSTTERRLRTSDFTSECSHVRERSSLQLRSACRKASSTAPLRHRNFDMIHLLNGRARTASQAEERPGGSAFGDAATTCFCACSAT